jgi:hypothetical protein
VALIFDGHLLRCRSSCSSRRGDYGDLRLLAAITPWRLLHQRRVISAWRVVEPAQPLWRELAWVATFAVALVPMRCTR